MHKSRVNVSREMVLLFPESVVLPSQEANTRPALLLCSLCPSKTTCIFTGCESICYSVGHVGVPVSRIRSNGDEVLAINSVEFCSHLSRTILYVFF